VTDTYTLRYERGEKGGRGSSIALLKFFLQCLFDKSESLTDLNNCDAIDRTEGEQGGAHERQ